MFPADICCEDPPLIRPVISDIVVDYAGADAHAAPLQPVYIPALPLGHFAALSEAEKAEYSEIVAAAQNANMKSLVSDRPAVAGQQYVTPLHPNDPAMHKSQAVGKHKPASKGAKASKDAAQQPKGQQGPRKGGGGNGGRWGKKNKNKNNKNVTQNVA